mgnify:CR=1 FL=1
MSPQSDPVPPAKVPSGLLLLIRNKTGIPWYPFCYWLRNTALPHCPAFSNVLFSDSQCFSLQKRIDISETFLHIQMLDSQCKIAM